MCVCGIQILPKSQIKLPVATACTFIDAAAVAVLCAIVTISATVATTSGVGIFVGILSC